MEAGIPEEAYVDNGKDYRKVRAGAARELHGDDRALSPECIGVLARLGIKTTNALPYHPQSKPIESWFGNTLHERFDKLWIKTYCGPWASKRPDECNDALKQHRLFLAGKVPSSPLPKASTFVKAARQFILEYHSRPHTGQDMNGRSPNQVFAELGDNARRLDGSNRDAINALFWDHTECSVREGGCVKLHRLRFEPADPDSKARMAAEIGRKVMVACDPLDLAEAIATDSDGHIIGRLQCSQLVPWGRISRDTVQASLRERRRFAKEMKQYKTAVGYGVKTELDALLERAGEALVIDAERVEPRRLVGAVGDGIPLTIEEVSNKYRHEMKAAAGTKAVPRSAEDFDEQILSIEEG
jgi:hypothetical protein